MALQTGDLAPDFKLQGVIGEKQGEFQLSAYRDKKNVVILFYVLDFTPFCAAELPPFQAGLSKLTEQDAVVVGIWVFVMLFGINEHQIHHRAQVGA